MKKILKFIGILIIANIKKILIIGGILMIASFSYYGAVDENGEKVISFEENSTQTNSEIQSENIIEEQEESIVEEKEEIAIIQASEIKQEEIQVNETQEKEVQKSTKTETTSKTATSDKTTESKAVIEEQKENIQQEESIVEETKVEEKVTTDISKTETKEETSKCSHAEDNNWYNTKAEAIAVYTTLSKEWEDKWVNDEIDYETYCKNCPYGYEVWSCMYCNKWTINCYYE